MLSTPNLEAYGFVGGIKLGREFVASHEDESVVRQAAVAECGVAGTHLW